MNKSVLSISLDTKIVNQTYGDAHNRHLEYAKDFENYTVIILNTANLKLLPEYHFDNLHIYLTNVYWKPWAIVKALYLGLKLASKYHPDVVTCQDPLATGLVAGLLKFFLKIPFVVQIHEAVYFTLEFQKGLAKRFLFQFISLLLRFSNGLRVVNKQVAKNLQSEFPKKIVRHIPMMVDLRFFYKPVEPKNKCVKFISVGRFIKSKNFELLISSFSHVVKKYPNCKLIIAGDGISKKSIQVKINELELKKNVSLLGMLNREQLKKAYHQADAFVLSSNHEGWPLVFMEAFAAGLPVITTEVGSAGDIVLHKQNGLVVNIGDGEALTQAMIYFIEHPNILSNYGLAGQKLIFDRNDKEVLKSQWIGLLKEV